MNFRDEWVTDEDGRKFVFTVEMQRQLQDAGLPIEPESLSELPEDIPVQTQRSDRDRSESWSDRSDEKSDSDDMDMPLTIQIDPQTGKYIGRMKWYNAKKGYGFIVRGAGEEIFFHKSGTTADPTNFQEGQWVLYDVEETRKGPEATDVEAYTGDTEQLA